MKPSFLLTIDIGNTSTSFSIFPVPSKGAPFRGAPSKPKWMIPVGTQVLQSAQRFPMPVQKKIRPLKKSRMAVIVSSVVPSLNGRLKKLVQKELQLRPQFVTHRNSGKVKIRYQRPQEVGSDRIVNARAGMALSSRPLIIIDFGTATTFDCVSSKGEYQGGVIAPGHKISAEALYQKTAKLPLVVLKKPANILGQNTLQSIQSGLYFGYRGLVREIVKNLKRKMGPQTLILATGGQAPWILKGLGFVDKTLPYLTHLGLYHIWQDTFKKNHVKMH